MDEYCKRQGWKVVRVYDDSGFSGAKDDRPALNEMLQDANKGKFDVLCCWKIDRLARSTAHLLHILTQLKNAGVDFCSTTQAIDTTTSYGKMVMTFLGAIAEFVHIPVKSATDSGIIPAGYSERSDAGFLLYMRVADLSQDFSVILVWSESRARQRLGTTLSVLLFLPPFLWDLL